MEEINKPYKYGYTKAEWDALDFDQKYDIVEAFSPYTAYEDSEVD